MDTMQRVQNDNAIDSSRETVLILRTCKADRTSKNNFQWPESGYVEAPDWQPTEERGNGLHGWLRGEGDASLGYQDTEGALGQVVETYADHIVDLGGKVKYPFGWVIFTGDLRKAAQIVNDKYAGVAVLFGTATAGYGGTATAGKEGMILIRHWNGKRYRFETANVGEDGIEAGVAYRLDDNGKFVKA